MKTKTTPGPWFFNVGKNGTIDGLPVIRIFNHEDMVIDFAHARGEQDLADAALICAAPEMLNVLKHLWLNGSLDAHTSAVVGEVIKKAEGRR